LALCQEFLSVYHEHVTTVAQKIGCLGNQTEASKHHNDKKTADNTSSKEMEAFNAAHEHEMTSQALTEAHNEYQRRLGKGVVATVAQNIGHLGQATEASKHHADAKTFDNTSSAEMQEYLRVHERQLTSKELTKAHDEYTRRMNKGGVKQFRLLDVDGNGKLDLEECISGSKILGLTEDQAVKWFTDLDKDGSGDVDMEVLNDVIC